MLNLFFKQPKGFSVSSTSSSKARFNSTKILGDPPGNHSYFIHSRGVSKETSILSKLGWASQVENAILIFVHFIQGRIVVPTQLTICVVLTKLLIMHMQMPTDSPRRFVFNQDCIEFLPCCVRIIHGYSDFLVKYLDYDII